MDKILVFGHKNPDTDSICSAIAFAYLKNKLGEHAEPVRLGEINDETKYALSFFKKDAPRLVDKVASETKSVILVDHNERQQSADDITKVRVLEVVDHHRIANFETNDPIYYRAEPVGCTATILTKIYKEEGIKIEPEIAGLMLSAIISDTLLFKSPTCTKKDETVANELAQIAGVDINSYGLEMLKAGADLSGKSVEELISLDAKEFQMGESKVEIAQVNTVDVNDMLKNKKEIENVLSKIVREKELDLFLFVITDILKNDSIAIAIGEKTNNVEKAFDVKLENNLTTLIGVVSRKKQIIPLLTKAFL